LPGEFQQQAVLLLAVLQEFAVGLGLLAQLEQVVVQSPEEGGGGRTGRGPSGAGHSGLGRSGSRGGQRGLGLIPPVEAAASAFELAFDVEVLALPVIAALAERPYQGVGRAGILPAC
jgi:hypothetical protein